MKSSLHCLKARLRLKCNKNQWHSSLNLVSQQLKLCKIFICMRVDVEQEEAGVSLMIVH